MKWRRGRFHSFLSGIRLKTQAGLFVLCFAQMKEESTPYGRKHSNLSPAVSGSVFDIKHPMTNAFNNGARLYGCLNEF